MTKLYSVVLADDNATIREVLRLMFAKTEFWVCGEAAVPFAVAKEVKRIQPDIVILDFIDGPELIEVIGEITEKTKVVMYSGHDDPMHIRMALAAGAYSYVIKRGNFDELCEVLREAVQ